MSSSGPKRSISKARLLCIDDNFHCLVLLAAVLKTAEYSVVASTDPCIAFELLTGTHFDLVILDFEMPRMSGAELASRVKQYKPDLPIILYSGTVSPPVAALCAVDDYLFKGEGAETLLQKVRARLGAIRPLA